MEKSNNLTALVVDDDRAIQRLLADALTNEGFSVLVEKDGEWALKTFEQRQVDVILLDLLLPALHGFEVARRIRLLPKGVNVPIIFMSGIYKSEPHKAETKETYGIVEFLDKPLNIAKLKAALKHSLGFVYPRQEDERKRREQLDQRPPEIFANVDAKEEAAEVEKAARNSAIETIQGEFATKPFPELLAELYRWKATGALLLRKEKIKKIVYFREGRPFYIKSNLLAECLGRLMIREKMISEADCEESLNRLKESKRQQGTELIEMGCISPHNLSYALALQLQTKLYDIFSWPNGEYQFNPIVEIPSEASTFDMTTAQIIYEGVKRTYSEEQVRAALGSVETLFVHPAHHPLMRFQEVGLDEEESALLASIDGHKTAGTLIALNLLTPPGTLLFLYAMRCSQMIELRREPAKGPVELRFSKGLAQAASRASSQRRPSRQFQGGLDGSPPPLPYEGVQRPPTSSLPDQQTARSQHRPPPLTSSLLPDLPVEEGSEERHVCEHLAATAASMKKRDYFQVLGVAPAAPRNEIDAAYLALAKEYHPDKHFKSYSAEVRKLAAEIFRLISTAYNVVTDDAERERYLAELSAGVKREVPDEVSKILAAEGKFQKGEELLRKRLYRDAAQCFKEAVEIYRDEGEFHSYLGWTLFQIDPQVNAQSSIASIETGIRLNPGVDKSYLFLGQVHKTLGHTHLAQKQFEKALQCNPDCIEALREIRLLGRARR